MKRSRRPRRRLSTGWSPKISPQPQPNYSPRSTPTVLKRHIASNTGRRQPTGKRSPARFRLDQDQEIEAELSGLTPHTVYHYRLVRKVEGKKKAARRPPKITRSTSIPPAVPTKTCASRRKPISCPTAAPTSSSRPEMRVVPSSSRRAQHRLCDQSLPLFLHRPLSTVPELRRQPDRRQRRPLCRHSHRYRLGQPIRRASSSEAAVDGGPPMGPPRSGRPRSFWQWHAISNGGTGTGSLKITSSPIRHEHLPRLQRRQPGRSIFSDRNADPSNAPYVWSADGSFLDRWPTNLGSVPTG